MSTNSQGQEIDLGQIGTGIKNFFNGIVNSIFDFIFFIKKKIVIIGGLFVVGIVLGFFLDKDFSYNQEISVIPNFGSNEYLYTKTAFLQSRLKENDEAFFKSLGVKDFKKITKINVEAFNGVFGFISSSEPNFELLKLMAEDGNLKEIIKEDFTSKNYYSHNITISTSEKINQKEIIDPILKYYQVNTFYQKQQVIHQENIDEKIKFNDSLVKQIDGLIIKLTDSKSASNVTISENSSITALINKKDELIKESQNLKLNKGEYEQIVKVINVSLNNLNTKGINNKMKLILPFVFVIFYLIGFKFNNLYRKQLARIKG
ncbi:hypothetical protein [Flavobacterium proteolyticum]|uniref:Polysaccharide chain length determinant N-terminal domain-containing protein n=1 Tax=Flavobacterium proteolyticum TaxID=2911683 RepID=A0ABR9WPD6_9FLAO|nr:hypothetical protein [Flavobacterium proteolyticum]MBE9575764.1 hypothetical protein [Flavobacterium proteolyticum]